MRTKYIISILISTCFLCTFQYLNAQSSLPPAIKKSFEKQYPNVKDYKWEKEGNFYEIEYKENGVEKGILFSPKGLVIENEEEINISSLPANVKSSVLKKYNDYKITEAEKIVRKGKIYYEIELKSKKNEIEVILDENGKHISRTVENDDEDDD